MKIITLVIIQLILSPLVFAAPENDYLNQGNLYVASGKFEKAVRAFEQAVKANPQNIEAYKGIGIAYYRLGDNEGSTNVEALEKSINAFVSAVKIKPDAESYYHIGLICLAFDDKDNARLVYGILKDIDRQISEGLAAKIAAYKEPEQFRYLNNEHNRAEEQREAEQELVRQQIQGEIRKQQAIEAARVAEQAAKAAERAERNRLIKAVEEARDAAYRAEDRARKAEKAAKEAASSQVDIPAGGHVPTGGYVIPGGQVILY